MDDTTLFRVVFYFLVIFTAVSYTHLDVYKRQVDFPLLFIQPRQDHGRQRFVCEGHIENVILIGDFLGGGLDVYKRQHTRPASSN